MTRHVSKRQRKACECFMQRPFIERGYMSDLLKKFQLKPNQSLAVFNAPEAELAQLQAELTAVSIATDPAEPQDAVLTFAQFSRDVAHYAPIAEKMLRPNGHFWIAYPKKSAGLETDMTRDKGWVAIADRWQGVRLISMNKAWSVLRFKPRESEADLLAAQYSNKPHLRPIYDQLAAYAQTLGDDVGFNIRKNYVAFVRSKQFARVHASTKTRVDLVLALKGKPFEERLEAAARLGDSAFTHKVVLTTADSVDAKLLAWVQEAYERN